MLHKVAEAENWLSSNQEADTLECQAKQKELKGFFNPIMAKVYQAAGGAPPRAGGFTGSAEFTGAPGGEGPEINEVD